MTCQTFSTLLLSTQLCPFHDTSLIPNLPFSPQIYHFALQNAYPLITHTAYISQEFFHLFVINKVTYISQRPFVI